MLKSPLNYTGNKLRILPQILPHFKSKPRVMVDLFCGGATVGINSDAETVIFVDSNERVISLLKYLASVDIGCFITLLIEKAKEYNLSVSCLGGYQNYFSLKPSANKNNGLKEFNKKGFYQLRKDYNQLADKESNSANLLLYLLLVYGFNNDLRFNSRGEYNLPCGKTDLNKNNIEKIKAFNKKAKTHNYTFICGDFREERIKKIVYSCDFLYCDPPYLITDAVYNETSKWNEQTENELIAFLQSVKDKGIPFVLSNVLSKSFGSIINKPLDTFIRSNPDLNVYDIDYHYRSSSYNKKNRDAKEREIIVVFGETK